MAIEVGQKAKFKGYSQLEEGQEPILTEGELVDVVRYSEEDELYTVASVADPNKADSVFVDELDEAPAEATEAAPAPAKTKRTRAKGKAKDAAPEPEAAAEEPEAAAEEPEGTADEPETTTEPEPASAKTKPAAAAKPAANGRGIVVLETIKDMVGSVDTALASAKQVAAALTNLREQEEQTVFTLGGLLSYIKQVEGYRQAGYEDISAYSERELGLKKRSADYYIRIYTELTEAGVTLKQIEGIGWTKLRTLMGAINPENKTELLKKARAMSRDDLEEHMKTVRANIAKGSPTTEAPQMTKFPAFRLFKDQADTFQTGLQSAMSTYNVDNMAEALFHVMMEWLQGQNADVPAEAALDTFNARYGTDFSMDEDDEEEGEQPQPQPQAATA